MQDEQRPALSDPEVRLLDQHEAVIGRGLSVFLEVEQALAAIRMQRLYRCDHDSAEAYCRERWQIDGHRARALVDVEVPPLDRRGVRYGREQRTIPDAWWAQTGADGGGRDSTQKPVGTNRTRPRPGRRETNA